MVFVTLLVVCARAGVCVCVCVFVVAVGSAAFRRHGRCYTFRPAEVIGGSMREGGVGGGGGDKNLRLLEDMQSSRYL